MTQNRSARRGASACRRCGGRVKNNSIQMCRTCVGRAYGMPWYMRLAGQLLPRSTPASGSR